MKNFTLVLALLIGCCVQSQKGIGTPNPDQSSILELASSQKGFLPPRLTTAQRDAIANPAEGLTIFNTTKNCLEWYITAGWYNACGDNGIAIGTQYNCNTGQTGTMKVGEPVTNVTQTITATVSRIGSFAISATANGVTFSARGNFTSIGNHDVVLHASGTPLTAGNHTFTLNTSPNTCTFSRTTITNSTESCDNVVVGAAGRTWMACNLGAKAFPKSSNDLEGFGDYYQWGRGNDGHQKLNSKTTKVLSKTNTPGHGLYISNRIDWLSTKNDKLWQGVNGVNNPCPKGFRIPTFDELAAEFQASKINNVETAYNSVLKLTAAGLRYENGDYARINVGYYATSNVYGISFESILFTIPRLINSPRGLGYTVRCIKD